MSQNIAEERKALKEEKQNLRNIRKEKASIERRMKILEAKINKVGLVKPPGRRLKELERRYKSLYFKYQTGQTPMSRERQIVAKMDAMEEELEELRKLKKNFFKSRHWKEELEELKKKHAELSKQAEDLKKSIEKREKKLDKLMAKMPEVKREEVVKATYTKEMPAEELNELADKIMKKFMSGEKITAEELAILQKAEGGDKNG